MSSVFTVTTHLKTKHVGKWTVEYEDSAMIKGHGVVDENDDEDEMIQQYLLTKSLQLMEEASL